MAIASPLVREVIAEFWGTFFLSLAVVSSASSGSLTPVAAGLVLMTQVYSYGYISGAQFNPAVTTAVTIVKLARKMGSAKDAITRFFAFCAIQLIAGMLAGAVGGSWVDSINPHGFTGFNTTEKRGTAWAVEFFFTFMLASSVLHCAVNAAYKESGNQFYGLVIGMSVTGGALAVGGFSGGCFNPAVAMAMDFAQRLWWAETSKPFSYYYIYLSANLLGGACAALNFLAISPTEEQIAAVDTDESTQLNEQKYPA